MKFVVLKGNKINEKFPLSLFGLAISVATSLFIRTNIGTAFLGKKLDSI